jgi:serine O-acetyltransferase
VKRSHLLISPILRVLIEGLSYRAGSEATVQADVTRWAQEFKFGPETAPRLRLPRLFLENEEFRSLLYNRLGTWRHSTQALRRLYPDLSTLDIRISQIGPGLFIQHGFSTMIAAREMGANCWVNHHQVTIGWTERGQPPVGNNVRIHCGAIVIGPVTIGDNVIVGAGAVVTKSIPAGSSVVGNPARILRHRDRPSA